MALEASLPRNRGAGVDGALSGRFAQLRIDAARPMEHTLHDTYARALPTPDIELFSFQLHLCTVLSSQRVCRWMCRGAAGPRPGPSRSGYPPAVFLRPPQEIDERARYLARRREVREAKMAKAGRPPARARMRTREWVPCVFL